MVLEKAAVISSLTLIKIRQVGLMPLLLLLDL